MKERPILFNGEMVRAILGGRKTQTRRVIKPQPASWIESDLPGFSALARKCPFGQPGDRLWVRETTVRVEEHGYVGPVYRATENGQAMLDHGLAPGPGDAVEVEPHNLRLRPSIHMPRSMARILLEVVSVRVERLQDISPNDCIEEGAWRIEDKEIGRGIEAVDAYRAAWEAINGPDSWAANPWVWVVEFKRVE